jgi:hypothetical protein
MHKLFAENKVLKEVLVPERENIIQGMVKVT